MNVPKLRFKEFNDEWVEDKINALVELNPKNPSLPESFIYIDLESVSNGILLQEKIINKNDAPSRAQRQVKLNDILYQTVRPYQKNNLFIDELSNLPYIASTGYAIMREKKIYQKFLFNKLHTDIFVNEVLDNCTGTSYPAINSNDLGNIKIYYPNNVKEQEKIGNFLSLLDKKIELQTKKIEDLKLFKKGLIYNLFSDLGEYNKIKLGNLCNITTGKLDANAMCENGMYRFYTCAKNYYYIDTYSFDTEALLISGNGAYVGYIHYYKGKFNAYQRTYVLDNFNENVFYIKTYLENFLPKRINSEKKEGNTPYIVLSTLTDMDIKIPSKIKQEQIINITNELSNKIHYEELLLLKLQQLKKGLMQNMFV